jgi:hypothetical protein
MIFTRLDWNQIQILIWIFVWIRAGHVSQYNWTIPFRVDLELRPLDLMWSAWSRLIGTGSLKWTDLVNWIKIGQFRLKRRGRRYLLGFRREILQRGRARTKLRRCSGGFWMMTRPRQGAGGQGGLRVLGRGPQLLAERSERFGWRETGAGEASASEAMLVLLRNKRR